MKITSLDGKTYSWNIYGHMPKLSDDRPRSKIHIKVREIIKEIYPQDALLEEVFIPGDTLYLDFYLPLRTTAIEVHGEQHYSFNNFHFKNKIEYLEARRRDNFKDMWCHINDIKLIIIKYNDDEPTIRQKLTS